MGKLIYILLFLIGVPGLNAQNPDELYCNGVASLQSENYVESINYLTSAIQYEPNNALLYLKRGEAHYKSGTYDDALTDFREASQLDENSADFWISKTYAMLGNQEQSLIYLKKHLSSGYHLKEKTIKKDDAFNDLQYSDGWHNLWQEEWYTEEEMTEDEVDYLMKKELYLDAITLLDEKISASENPHKLHACRARVNMKLGNFKGAAADWENAIDIERKIPGYYIERGRAYYEAGKFRNSIDDFTRVLRQDPALFTLYIERANAYARLKEFTPAIRDVVTYLKYFENDQDAIALCGNLHYTNENYIEALKYFNRNLKLDNTKAVHYKDRGKTYLKTGIYKFAINDLSMALDLSPYDGETYLYKGIARFESGDKEGACSDWSKARKYGEMKAVEYLLENCE
ncbi:MAG: tetratricopeptide repeat protein [Bacteroidales bacterium]|nr:MAG: tetratricopeptide repeat protein [Bacteroidales bacterium]